MHFINAGTGYTIEYDVNDTSYNNILHTFILF